MTHNCGEAGCADGCCGSAECLPSAKGKLGAGSPSIRVEAQRVIEAWESSPLRSNDGMLFERIEDLRTALKASLPAKEAECEALRVQLAAGPLYSTRLKAKRYDWLREQSHPWGSRWLSLQELDAAIDAARAAADQGGA